MPAALEINPKQVFDRLFRGRKPKHPSWDTQLEEHPTNGPQTVEQSVLDAIAEDTRSLQRQLGFEDRRKLEAYLDGLRSVERRVQAASSDAYSHHQDAFESGVKDLVKKPDGFSELCEVAIPDGRGIPKEYQDHVELMLDVLTLAFQTDATRVASFMFSYEKSGRNYSSIGAKGSHHSLSHHENTEKKLSALTKINTLHMQLFASMLEKMRNIQEGDSTLLDNTLFLYGSGISDGNKHNHDDLPILLAGGGGGTIQGGRHLKLGEKTPICNAYLDMLHCAGIQRKQFGDSTGRLNGLA